MTGSGATSIVWTQILADVLDQPLGLSDQAVEGRGAVVCLAVALGRFKHIDEAADVMVPLRGEAVPDPKRVAAYRDIYLHWSEINELSRAFDLADR